MSIYIRIKDNTVNVDSVENWKIIKLWGGDKTGHAIIAYLKKSNGLLSSPRMVHMIERLTKEQADDIMTRILNGIIEAEKNGGGVVSIM